MWRIAFVGFCHRDARTCAGFDTFGIEQTQLFFGGGGEALRFANLTLIQVATFLCL
ncbi:MAG: hypothetical protein WBH00_18165 [Xanthobacteraceae bacterium]